MKTIEQASVEYSKTQYGYDPTMRFQCETHFEAGIEFAQEWISVDEKPDTPKRDEEGVSYSDWLLIKVEGFEHPFIGYYVKANDDEFFDIYPEVSGVVNQEDITHYRYIELK